MDPTVLFQLSYGVYAIGVIDEDRPCGCIVNTVIQITSDPATIGVSLNKNNHTTELVEKNKKFTVSILTEDVDSTVIGSLGFSTGKGKNKFEKIPYETLGGLPLVKEGASGYLLCEVISVTENGTHDVILAKVLDTKQGNGNTPMTYKYYHEVKKGTAPKNAPTYRGKKEEEGKPAGKRYVCQICGHIHEGELPEDFICPICGMPASAFKEE